MEIPSVRRLATSALLAGVALAVLLLLGPSAVAQTVEPPAGIDATGATDVTAPLLRFISEVPDGSTITFPAGARYRIDGSLVIANRHDLTFEGNGAEFFAATEGDRERRHWWIRDSSGITIRDVTVHGANPHAGTTDAGYRAEREAQHGFDLAGTSDALLDGVTVTDVYGDFVYIGPGDTGLSKRITVRDSTFERNGRQGLAITGGEDVLIERNSFSHVRRSTFDIEPNTESGGVRRVTISDNDIGPGRLNFVAGHGAAAPVEDIVVSGNRLTGKTMNVSLKAPPSRRRTNFTMVGNMSDASFGSPAAAITIEGFDGVEIRDNVLPLAPDRDMTAVKLRSTCGAVVEGNDFRNATRDVATDGYGCASADIVTPSVAPQQLPDGGAGDDDDEDFPLAAVIGVTAAAVGVAAVALIIGRRRDRGEEQQV